MPVDPPTRLPAPPAELGRLGTSLSWLAAAQGAWPPRVPVLRRTAQLGEGGLAAGIAAADSHADCGADLITVEGPPATVAALVVLCVLLDLEPVVAIGTATAPGWSELVIAVREALPAARSAVGDPERLVDDPVLGHATGLLAQSAARRTPLVLGTSPVLAAAALAADRLAPGARRWWLAASQVPGTAVRRAYADLGLDPLLDLGLTAPGSAALAADLLASAISLTGTQASGHLEPAARTGDP
jgi:nicotinate-nucleotide--dimethylbenzimidazole phosphoribosyltransferase